MNSSKTITQKILLLMAMALTVFTIGTTRISAESDEGNPKFSVEAVLPENQLDATLSYFHLSVKPGTHQVLEVKATNYDNKDIVIEPKVEIGLSNNSGTVVYDGSTDGRLDESLQYNIKDLASVSNKVMIPANSEVIIPIEVNVPDQPFEGILLGGLSFAYEPKEGNSSAGIGHRVTYLLGLVLTNGDDVELPISKSLDLINVRTEVQDLKKVTLLEFVNKEPAMLNKLNIQAKVVKADSGEEVIKTETMDYTITPNSIIDYRLDWKYRDVEAGKYIARVSAQSHDESWTWEIPFEVTDEEAEKANSESAYKVVLPTQAKNAIIFAGILTLINALYLVIRMIKRK